MVLAFGVFTATYMAFLGQWGTACAVGLLVCLQARAIAMQAMRKR